MRGEGPRQSPSPQHQVHPPQQQPPQRRGPAAQARDTTQQVSWLQQRQELGAVGHSEKVFDKACNVKTRNDEGTDLEASFVSNSRYACEHFGYTTGTDHGVNVHKGHKHKVTQVNAEKERTHSFKGDRSLSLTPPKEL